MSRADDLRGAQEAGASLGRSPWKKATITVRCLDCDGRLILYVRNVGSRPLVWTASPFGAGVFTWADRVDEVAAWCRWGQRFFDAHETAEARGAIKLRHDTARRSDRRDAAKLRPVRYPDSTSD